MTEQNTSPNRRKKISTALAAMLVILIVIATLWKLFWPSFSKEVLLHFKASTEAIKSLQNEVAQQQTILQELQNEAQKQNSAKTTNWKLITIEHLVRMADLTLNTTGDVKAALALLLAAKKYAQDPAALAINHALNKDIISLQATPTIDTEMLVLKIDTISQQIAILPILPPQIAATQTTSTVETQQLKNMLNLFVASATKALKDIVIIRHQVTEPMLPPEQITILRLNIQAKLLQAGLAVMQKQNKLYQTCLTQAFALITQYFAINNIVTTNILQTLKELQQVDLQPKLPTLTESLEAIQNVTESSNAPISQP